MLVTSIFFFSHNVSRGYFLRVIKRRDCVVELSKKAFHIIVGKGENAGYMYQFFSFLHNVFYPLWRQSLSFIQHFIFRKQLAFIFASSKILFYGKGLNIKCGKQRKQAKWAILSLDQMCVIVMTWSVPGSNMCYCNDMVSFWIKCVLL